MRAEIELRMTTSRSHLLICCKVGGQEDILMENKSLLQSLTSHIITDTSGVPEQVPLSILSMLVPLASDLLSPTVGTNFVGFPDLRSVMSGLAAVGRGRGHVILFPTALDWLITVKQFMIQKKVIEKLKRYWTIAATC